MSCILQSIAVVLLLSASPCMAQMLTITSCGPFPEALPLQCYYNCTNVTVAAGKCYYSQLLSTGLSFTCHPIPKCINWRSYSEEGCAEARLTVESNVPCGCTEKALVTCAEGGVSASDCTDARCANCTLFGRFALGQCTNTRGWSHFLAPAYASCNAVDIKEYFSNSCSGFGWERRVSGDTCSDAVQSGMHSYYTMRYTCHSALESRVPSPADIDRIAFVLSKSRTQKP